MQKVQKTYTPEFKRSCATSQDQWQPIAQVARELGISELSTSNAHEIGVTYFWSSISSVLSRSEYTEIFELGEGFGSIASAWYA